MVDSNIPSKKNVFCVEEYSHSDFKGLGLGRGGRGLGLEWSGLVVLVSVSITVLVYTVPSFCVYLHSHLHTFLSYNCAGVRK